MLVVEGLEVRYGVIPAVKNLNIEVKQGEIVTLIGANGAGKSTTLKTISGLVRPHAGKIMFEGQDITGKPAHEIVAMGISQIPEGRGIFPNLTVRENLKLGMMVRKDSKGEQNKDLEMVFSWFAILRERINQVAGTLSGGEQQMLAIGRALMMRPKLMLMDEPSMGLAPLFIQQIFDIIKEINAKGTTIVLVEQNAWMALSTAHRAYALETGEITASGAAENLLHDPSIKRAYLGY
jgi:branched-chain amino acid transport system ATP-binding protein